ncbi:hypothetical protein ES703_60064 [subsurface metagenome]
MCFRKLTDTEIKSLERLGCTAESWNRIQVAEPFRPESIQNVRFSGHIAVGSLEKTVTLPGGIERPAGLYNSAINNCSIGDNAFISNVNILSNYDLEDEVIVENVNSLLVHGSSSFGNGTELSVLNEAGGRTLKIFDRLSAQIAYLLVCYRHKPEMIKNLKSLIESYVKGKVSRKGRLGRGCRIVNSSQLINLAVGPYATVSGALYLEDGTIDSCAQDPSTVGEGVTARHFIILSGSKVQGSSILEACFVGQGVLIGKQFSADNSAFFANFEGFHGEAASILAGPYTVTHHKSTLLIAGLFSFFNAGSGTNQSNHRYKLGPVHQGILERGCKTGSFSYLMWPCRIGPYSVVMGKHSANFDTSIFPFSYLTEKDGKSLLTPAVNIFTVGTRRDSIKWPARDRRKDPEKLDLINFELFNPYTVGRMVSGLEALYDLAARASKTRDLITYRGVQIRRLMLKSCARYYEIGIKIFLGDCLYARLNQFLPKAKSRETSLAKLKGALAPKIEDGVADWVDICGLIAPSVSVRKLVAALAGGRFTELSQVTARLKSISQGYSEAEWAWSLNLLENRSGLKLAEFTQKHLSQIIIDWKQKGRRISRPCAALLRITSS